MLGELWLIRFVTAPIVMTLPCTLPVFSLIALTQDEACALLFRNNMYLLMSSASGMVHSFNVPSLTTGLPVFSVNCLGFHPRFINLSPICCRLCGLNGCIFVFVFITSIVGSKVSTNFSLSIPDSSSSTANKLSTFS